MWWVDDTNPASLVIETTITDKCSGEEVPYFTKVEVANCQELLDQRGKFV